MDSAFWEKVKRIFSEALSIDEDKRGKFLDEACSGDDNLRQEVESLITSFGSSGEFLDEPEKELKFSTLPEKDSYINKIIGAYKISSLIAEGGMGRVYLGVRTDNEFSQKVAIKLIKHESKSSYMLQRFQNERQTLANLNHPYIANLLDGGTTEDGVPYFIMEYIDGKPLIEYCDENRLTIDERLLLFQKICSAVNYAHKNLVVHRDLKPSNILITKDGNPKLLDFGIAKILKEDSTSNISDQTVTKVWNFTPDYASPEQIKGEKITTSTDIYSLGVVLYKLLTGHHPYNIKSYLPAEITKIVCETNTEKPSTIVRTAQKMKSSGKEITNLSPEDISKARKESVEKLSKKLTGDLDNIILMAMRKDPERRYSSVEQFSEDIRRHLEGLPIIARKNSMGYKSRKFFERHRAGVITAFIFLLIIIAGITEIIIQSNSAAKERDKAIVEAKKAERINTFLQDILAAPNPEVDGKDVKVVDVLKNASKKINKELSDDPEIKASALYTIGTTYIGLGLYNEAEQYLKNSLNISERIYSSNDPQIAKVMVQLGANYQDKGNYKKADSLYKTALKIFRLKGGKFSSGKATALSDYGSSLHYQGKYDEAKKYQTEALNEYRKIYGNNNPNVINSLNDLGTIAGDVGDWNSAAKYAKEVLDLSLKTDGKESVDYSLALSNYASTLEVEGKLDEAIKYQREAVEIKKRIQGENHPDAMFAQITLADELMKRGDNAEAAKLSKEAMESLDKSLPHINALTTYSRVVYANALIKLKDFKKALPFIDDALKIREKLYSPNHYLITATKVLLGTCLAGLKKYTRAEQILKNCYSKIDKKDEGKKYIRILTLQNLVKVYKATGNKKAERQYEADLDKENN